MNAKYCAQAFSFRDKTNRKKHDAQSVSKEHENLSEPFREIEIASGLLFALLRVFFGSLLGYTLKPMPN